MQFPIHFPLHPPLRYQAPTTDMLKQFYRDKIVQGQLNDEKTISVEKKRLKKRHIIDERTDKKR